MVQRIVYRRRNSYRTISNRLRAVKTPGGILKGQYIPKTTSGVRCGDTGALLQGIPHMTASERKGAPRRAKSVSRIYGGHLSAKAVRDRIMRAFLLEEQKVVKKVMKVKAKEEAAARKAASRQAEKKEAAAAAAQQKAAAKGAKPAAPAAKAPAKPRK